MSRPPCIAGTPLPYPHAESQFMLVRGARPWTTAGIYMSAVLNRQMRVPVRGKG